MREVQDVDSKASVRNFDISLVTHATVLNDRNNALCAFNRRQRIISLF
jgi:hypothetical protein